VDDFSEKLRSILSDEESLDQIRTLYETVSGGRQKKDSSDQENNVHDECGDTAQEEQSDFDFSTLLKIQSLFENSGKDDAGAALISALRPHLSAQRQERADKAIKMLNLFSVAAVLKESGLLGDLI